MAVFDTGPVDNRNEPRTTNLAIRLFNTGRLPAIAGIEAYQIIPAGDGFTSETLYAVELVSLNPFGTTGSGFTLDNVFANLDVFGVRVITSGLGANGIAVTVLEKESEGQIIKEHILEGELSRIQELLFVYVSNQEGDTITVLNSETNTIVKTIPLTAGSSPQEIAITPDGTRAYIAIFGTPNSVIVVNTATNTIVSTIPFPAGSNPQGIAITPDGSRAYVTLLGTPDAVAVIDTATNMVVFTIPFPAGNNPFDIAITPDGSRAYVTNNGLPHSVTVIDTATDSILTTIPLPAGSFPFGIAITPDGSRAYVTNSGTPDAVTVIDTATNMILLTIPFPAGSNPTGIAITPDGSRAYVTTVFTVRVINTATNEISTTIPFPAGVSPSQIAITPDGLRAYLTNSSNDTLSIIDTVSNTIITSSLPAGDFPFGIAITPILLF